MMNRALYTSFLRILPGLWSAVFILLFVLHKPGYLNISDTYFWVALLTLPFSFQLSEEKGRMDYFWLALICGLFTIFFTTTISVYATLICSLLFICQLYWGKPSFLFAIHLMLLSPLFQYIESLVSFPARLMLSEFAGNILQTAGFDIAINGNLMQLDGSDFLVDKACAGLFMLRYGILFGLLMMTFFQEKKKEWKVYETAALLLFLFGLNVASNLVRIVLLVVFRIMPENVMHDGLGLITFVGYNLLPFYIILRFLNRRKKAFKKEIIPSNTSQKSQLFPGILLILLAIVSWKNHLRDTVPYLPAQFNLYGNKAVQVNPHVYKVKKEKALIYIKKPVEAYHADHNPLICWRGSGFDFKKIERKTINGLEVSTAELVKGEEKLFTLWWFDSGSHRTGSQWDWRWRALRHQEDFYLVNVSAESYAQLEKEAAVLMKASVIKNINQVLN